MNINPADGRPAPEGLLSGSPVMGVTSLLPKLEQQRSGLRGASFDMLALSSLETGVELVPWSEAGRALFEKLRQLFNYLGLGPDINFPGLNLLDSGQAVARLRAGEVYSLGQLSQWRPLTEPNQDLALSVRDWLSWVRVPALMESIRLDAADRISVLSRGMQEVADTFQKNGGDLPLSLQLSGFLRQPAVAQPQVSSDTERELPQRGLLLEARRRPYEVPTFPKQQREPGKQAYVFELKGILKKLYTSLMARIQRLVRNGKK